MPKQYALGQPLKLVFTHRHPWFHFAWLGPCEISLTGSLSQSPLAHVGIVRFRASNPQHRATIELFKTLET
ncbi:MAG: hypothetical protein R3B96_25315 [Pirellulaceae bacterium]